MVSPQRRFTLIAAAAAALVATALVVVSRERILEIWYLHQLASDDEAALNHAAEWLIDVDSSHLITRLVEVIRDKDRDEGFVDFHGSGPYSREIGTPHRIYLTRRALWLYTAGASNKGRQRQAEESLLADQHAANPGLAAVVEAWRFLAEGNPPHIYQPRRAVAERLLVANEELANVALISAMEGWRFSATVVFASREEIRRRRMNSRISVIR